MNRARNRFIGSSEFSRANAAMDTATARVTLIFAGATPNKAAPQAQNPRAASSAYRYEVVSVKPSRPPSLLPSRYLSTKDHPRNDSNRDDLPQHALYLESVQNRTA